MSIALATAAAATESMQRTKVTQYVTNKQIANVKFTEINHIKNRNFEQFQREIIPTPRLF